MALPDPSMWRNMLAFLNRHHADVCRHWFEELEPLELDGGMLQVRAENKAQISYLKRQCTEAFNEAAQSVTHALVAVRFVDGENGHAGDNGRPRHLSTPSASEPSAARSSAGGRREFTQYDELALSPDYTFDNFVTGPGNRLAYAASVAVAQQPGLAYNPLFIHGGVGLGKTHLLQAICMQILDDRPEAAICYLSCDTFVNNFMESVQNGQMNEFRHRYRDIDVLIIDDIHFLANRERTQEEFFHTFNTLYQTRKQIVLSSDSPPNEIPQLEERLISRFNWGLVARVDKPCYETRVAIVQKKARLRGLALPDDVVCYIASRIDSNTRELEGAITKVQSLAMVREESIRLELAQDALGDQLAPAPGPQLSIQHIIDEVTDYYDVKLADLQSKRRQRSITAPRQVCMYLARQRTRYSLEEIGGYFGGRDHTTVMHAIQVVRERMNTDAGFAQQVDEVDKRLTDPAD